MGVDVFGMVMGLGFVLVVRILVHGFPGGAAGHGREFDVGRPAHAADAAFPKMLMPFIVILPGIAAVALTQWPSAITFRSKRRWPGL